MNTRSTFHFLRFALGLVLLYSLVLGDVSPASAALQCYVKTDATGANNGSSWSDAYESLQSALGGSPCTVVWVASGTYKPTGGSSTDRAISFVLKNGVAIYGGFAGGETLLSQRNPAANPTILSGEIGAAGNSDNSYHVVVGSGTNSTAVLDGFTITGGNADGTGDDNSGLGGGMYSSESSPRIKNVTFSSNLAQRGGGMWNTHSSPILVDVAFSGNQANWVDSGNGGGMGNYWQSSPSLTNVTFYGNWADGQGGGMSNETSSSPTLTNVTFSGNFANAGGGMANLYSSSPRLMNVTFSGNGAGWGNGMDNLQSSPIITNSILFDYPEGAEIYNAEGSSPTVSYSIIQGGYVGTGNLNVDPLLRPLQNNGGFTQTQALASNSPAIDKGTNAGCPAKDQRGITRPQGPRCDMGAYEYSPGKLTLSSTGAQDGWILESTETSGVGGTMNAIQPTFAVGDDNLDRQGLSILSFNTAGLPDNAVIKSVTLKIRGAGVVGTDPFTTHGNILVDVRKGAFSGNAALQLQDFQALASRNGVLTMKNNPVGGWYSGAMGAANFAYINKTGLTQFRLRFAEDDNDDRASDYLKFHSGDCATAAYRPKLIVTYITP